MSKITSFDVELNNKIPVLVKESEYDYIYDEFTPNAIAAAMNDMFRLARKAEEHCYVMSFDNKGNPIGVFFLSKGTVNASLANTREVYLRALISGASAIALIHNHPSGDLTPSKEDKEIALKLRDAGDLLRIEFIDSIIIGGNDFYSFAENNMFK